MKTASAFTVTVIPKHLLFEKRENFFSFVLIDQVTSSFQVLTQNLTYKETKPGTFTYLKNKR